MLNDDQGFSREKLNQTELLLKELVKLLALAEHTEKVFKKRVREKPQKKKTRLYNTSAPQTTISRDTGRSEKQGDLRMRPPALEPGKPSNAFIISLVKCRFPYRLHRARVKRNIFSCESIVPSVR